MRLVPFRGNPPRHEVVLSVCVESPGVQSGGKRAATREGPCGRVSDGVARGDRVPLGNPS